jgi:hypothetical protein
LAIRIGAVFKLGMIASLLLLAAAGAGYYVLVYLPQRDAHYLRKFEKALADAAKRAAQLRVLAQQQELDQRLSAEEAAAETSYQGCLGSAAAVHDASWAAECKHLAEKTEQDRAECLSKLNLSKAYCEASYASRDASPKCTLPDEIASVLDADLERARFRCVRERKAAEKSR